MRRLAGYGFALLGLLVGGCSSIGPATISNDRVDYARVIGDTWKDQLVLNIVRLRYADTPSFMDVSSIVGSYTVQGTLQAGAATSIGRPSTSNDPRATASVSASAVYGERPTISYTPLAGAKFYQTLLKPIPPAAIVSLIAAGYPADLVIPLTVRGINGIYNSTFDSGVRRPASPEFVPLVNALRRIQISRSLDMHVDRRGGQDAVFLVFTVGNDAQTRRDSELIQRTLHLKPKNGEVAVTSSIVQSRPDEIGIVTRPMIEIIKELAAAIEVPAAHVAAGNTYPNAVEDPNGLPPGFPKLQIRSGSQPPGDTFAAARYLDTWYWVSNQDLDSKRTLTFLLLFFSLAETGVTPQAPVLTIPVQ